MKSSKLINLFSVLPVNRKAATTILVFLIMPAILMMMPNYVGRADNGSPPAPTATPAVTPNPEGNNGDMGPLTKVDDQVHKWGGYMFTLLADVVVITVAIVGMVQCLKAAGSGFLGMHGQTGAAIVGLVGIVLVVLVTFVALPAFIQYLSTQKPAVPF